MQNMWTKVSTIWKFNKAFEISRKCKFISCVLCLNRLYHDSCDLRRLIYDGIVARRKSHLNVHLIIVINHSPRRVHYRTIFGSIPVTCAILVLTPTATNTSCPKSYFITISRKITLVMDYQVIERIWSYRRSKCKRLVIPLELSRKISSHH
jgi:hypothetical protein